MNTPIGDLSRENCKYLYEQGVVTVDENKEIQLSGKMITQGIEHPLRVYSLFQLVVEDIQNGSGKKMNMDMTVDVMRNGISSIIGKGKELSLTRKHSSKRI